MKVIQDKIRKERKKLTSEDFTPSSLVLSIVDKIDESDPKKTVLDPACGNGNLLIGILESRLKNKVSPFKALETLFGCDIMSDNISECKERLLSIAYPNCKIPQKAIDTLNKHIVHTPLDKYPNGSLDYLDREDAFEGNNDYVKPVKSGQEVIDLFEEIVAKSEKEIVKKENKVITKNKKVKYEMETLLD